MQPSPPASRAVEGGCLGSVLGALLPVGVLMVSRVLQPPPGDAIRNVYVVWCILAVVGAVWGAVIGAVVGSHRIARWRLLLLSALYGFVTGSQLSNGSPNRAHDFWKQTVLPALVAAIFAMLLTWMIDQILRREEGRAK